mmetsp:Transcript_23598/g.45841  ORF Transcript_23598/g.45841 Transcript_23598/m.45841 type:complete len:180 (-) Transcript_23598:562-1101(-)
MMCGISLVFTACVLHILVLRVFCKPGLSENSDGGGKCEDRSLLQPKVNMKAHLSKNIDSDIVFYGAGCCRFDNWQAEARGSVTKDACSLTCRLDLDCIAADMARPQNYFALHMYECFHFYGEGDNFHTECNTEEDSRDECWWVPDRVTPAPTPRPTPTPTPPLHRNPHLGQSLVGAPVT